MKLRICAAFAALLVLLAGCRREGAQRGSQPGEEASGDGRLQVVTTIFPPYDFVREIAGEEVSLTMLLSPGAESHSYEPTPQDITTIQNCDLFIYVGGEGDAWVDRILDATEAPDRTVIALVDLVDTVEEEYVEGMEHDHSHEDDDDDDHQGEDHDHEDTELDEHVWTSPRNAAVIVASLSDSLCRLDSAHADVYRENTDIYLEKLRVLDAGFQAVVDEGSRNTLVFGDRFPFRYLADAYGLDYFAAFPGCATETEASVATVIFLIDKVKEEEIPVVFHIELSNERMADTICEDTGAKKLLLHSCHNLTKDEFDSGAGYLSLMNQNLEHLREALA